MCDAGESVSMLASQWFFNIKENNKEKKEMIRLKNFTVGICWVAAVVTMSGCDAIDEDMSDCGQDSRIDYRLELVTNITTELNSKLDAPAEQPVAEALRSELSTIFTDYAHDIDLSFYAPDSLREKHETHIMDARQASYTVYLPVKDYMHLAMANIANAQTVTVTDSERAPMAHIAQQNTDTVGSQTTGLFTARKSMKMVMGTVQTYNVDLYMANCATSLVVDTTGHTIKGMTVMTRGFADGFYVRDSLYTFSRNPIITANEIAVPSSTRRQCFYNVCFPSATTEAQPDNGLWQIKAYVKLTDGTITENILHIKDPLRAGNLMIIKARLHDKGEIVPDNPEVGVSVKLDWNQGGEYNPEI